MLQDIGSAFVDDLGSTSLSITDLTVSTGSGLAIYAAIFLNDSVAHDAQCTWNGSSTGVTRIFDSGTGARYMAVFRINNPATGNNTLAFTWTTGARAIAIARAYSNVDINGTPNGTVDSSTGTNSTITNDVTSESNDIVCDFVGQNNNTTGFTMGSGQTDEVDVSGVSFSLASSQKAGATTVTMSWTGAFEQFRHTRFNINIITTVVNQNSDRLKLKTTSNPSVHNAIAYQ